VNEALGSPYFYIGFWSLINSRLDNITILLARVEKELKINNAKH